MATNRPTIDNNESQRLYKELRIDYHSSLEYEFITEDPQEWFAPAWDS
jgi:hypothetical protein